MYRACGTGPFGQKIVHSQVDVYTVGSKSLQRTIELLTFLFKIAEARRTEFVDIKLLAELLVIEVLEVLIMDEECSMSFVSTDV